MNAIPGMIPNAITRSLDYTRKAQVHRIDAEQLDAIPFDLASESPFGLAGIHQSGFRIRRIVFASPYGRLRIENGPILLLLYVACLLGQNRSPGKCSPRARPSLSNSFVC